MTTTTRPKSDQDQDSHPQAPELRAKRRQGAGRVQASPVPRTYLVSAPAPVVGPSAHYRGFSIFLSVPVQSSRACDSESRRRTGVSQGNTGRVIAPNPDMQPRRSNEEELEPPECSFPLSAAPAPASLARSSHSALALTSRRLASPHFTYLAHHHSCIIIIIIIIIVIIFIIISIFIFIFIVLIIFRLPPPF